MGAIFDSMSVYGFGFRDVNDAITGAYITHPDTDIEHPFNFKLWFWVEQNKYIKLYLISWLKKKPCDKTPFKKTSTHQRYVTLSRLGRNYKGEMQDYNFYVAKGHFEKT